MLLVGVDMKYKAKKTIISLTSYPNRIETVHKVIESLFGQTEKVDEIILWLSKIEFPKRGRELPQMLKCLIGKNGFRIEWVEENLKSHKKYFYALQEDNNIVITVDDDMIYANTMVKTLMDSYRLHPNAISARNVHMIFKKNNAQASYKEWEYYVSEYSGMERMDMCAIGVNGILYPPGCANKQWFDLEGIESYAENQDDLWLKYHEIIDKIPIVYTGMGERDVLIEGTQNMALYIKNHDGRNNDICWSKLMSLMKRNHATIYYEWNESLIEKEDFIQQKRRYYYSKLKNLFIEDKDIYIGGAGKYAHILYQFIKSCGKANYIKAFLVTVKEKTKDIIDIKTIQELNANKAFTVICGVGKRYREELKRELDIYELCEWVDVDLNEIMRLLSLEIKCE